jgi:hypothetical protein
MISQILGAVMLIYLLVAILWLMAELWSSPPAEECGPDHPVAGTGDSYRGAPGPLVGILPPGPGPLPHRGVGRKTATHHYSGAALQLL